MLQVLSKYNNISSRPVLLLTLYAFVAFVATNNTQSTEVLDFGKTFVAASQLAVKLERSLQYKRESCNSNNNNNNTNNQTSLTCLDAGPSGAVEGENVTVASRILSRRKRFLAFPLGSSFSCSVCLTTGVIGNPNTSYLSMGLNWGFAYDLPNVTWVLDQTHALKRGKNEQDMEVPTMKRRHRRDLYHKLETIINNMGYSGRECVLRALCESRQYFTRHKMGMIGEMLRVVFSLPKQRLFTRELRDNSDIGVYDHAYRKARAVDCAIHYDCSFSLLELAFGRYAKPPKDYYDKFGM